VFKEGQSPVKFKIRVFEEVVVDYHQMLKREVDTGPHPDDIGYQEMKANST